MKKLLIATLVASTALAGCATTGSSKTPVQTVKHSQQPDWVTQPPLKKGLAYGVGSMEIYGDQAAAVKRAAELARVDLVSQLKVTVSGDFSNDTTEFSGSGRQTEVVRTVRNYVRSQVPEAELDDVVTADTYIDQTYAYVLAELDRVQAAARLRRDIAATEQQIEDIAALSPEGTRLQQLQPLLPALTLFAQRERLSERLQLVSMDRQAAPLSAELRQVQDDIYRRVDQLQVRLTVNNDGGREIEGGVLEALTEQGLRIGGSADADLQFDLGATLSAKAQSGNHYVFIDSRLTIRDQSGRILSSFSKQAKGVSGLQDVARQKAARQVAALMADELAATLVDKLR